MITSDLELTDDVQDAIISMFDHDRRFAHYTHKQIKGLERVAGYLTDAQMADYLGMSLTMFKKRLSLDDELRSAYLRGKSKSIINAGEVVNGKVQEQDLQAAMFYLKTKGGWKESQSMELSVEQAPKFEDFYKKDV